ncbi:MAG: type II secretion system F family protein [Firmicutes bacterium]|nr:type II secretion system F family protein [Bacillota bacterium]
MEQSLTPNEKKVWYIQFLSFFKNIFLVIFSIFSYAFIGVKACTYDLFVYLYNSTSWRLDKAYKRTKEALGNQELKEPVKKKKEKVYNYSAKTLAKLEQEYQELVKDLQTTGATRSKEVNVYYFKVRDKNGKIIKGTMNGLSKLDINAFLVNEGYSVYSIKTSPMINFLYKESSIGSPKMKTKELIFWLTQLSTYLKAGITLNESVKILTKQMSSSKSKARAFQAISYELTLGSSFSAALEKQGSMFPALLINMIKAAEASGTLVETLEDMGSYYTEIDETKKQMKSAMTYPLIISIFAIVVVAFILVVIIPKFVDIYEQNNIELNGLTAFIIKLSAFLQSNIVIIILLIILAVIVLVVSYKNIKAFRRSMQTMLMHIPVIKDIMIYNELAIFTKTFASLLRNNVFITESIDILSKITNNEIYKSILFRTINNIVKGEKISEAFKDHWAVPDVAYFMIVTGESTGELDNMMQKVSEYYQGLHRNVVNNLKAFIEPILISFLALVVGGIIIAVLVPMFGMYGQIM